MLEAAIKYSDSLVPARFVNRLNRFMISCKLVRDGEEVEAHLPDSGRLKELLISGKELYLLPNANPNRKTKFSAVCVERPDGLGWVSINSQIPNKLAQLAFTHYLLPSFRSWDYERAEFTKGHSRWDHLLKTKDEKMIVEVKGVTLADENQKGFFPDAVTSRGTKHVLELIEINKEPKWRSALLFVAQREDLTEIRPASHIDPKFAKALKEASIAGVKIIACRSEVTLKGIRLLDEIPVCID
ncbi:DNA/RNA nuclease SfsA [Salipaludibacillus keqinensis]|uniref:Sugar fermentation stimulation protein homolog n=1 Tax=Salipaludibacillus keqinensis TaxID=2045207 RepID=A0A323TGW4_9BACI|nr:DNA/RNA nuclease SfsA [Salipaludibacillus keqinensis]PYZ94009.1 DNA/RNA nuclease SfsA [Salipaludibacillus keqinensis]